jgi:hypothetical protein
MLSPSQAGGLVAGFESPRYTCSFSQADELAARFESPPYTFSPW